MRTLYYATSNAGKLHSLKRRIERYDVEVVQANLDIPEPRSSDVEEIAKAKADLAFGKILKECIVVDAGFYIPSLGGFPRAFVNFALETIGLPGILRLVDGKARACEFRECLAYMGEAIAHDEASTMPDPRLFTSHIRGTLAAEPRGVRQPYHWSELSTIFIPEGETKTLGEMDEGEYYAWASDTTRKESCHVSFTEWYVRVNDLKAAPV